MNDVPIHVVGGGLAGLTAAITAADAGAPVVLHEASHELGGRARSGDGPYGVNLGPHVLYDGGAVTTFLHRFGLRRSVQLRLSAIPRARIVDERGVHGPIRGLRLARALARRREAPVDARFDDWAHATFDDRAADDLVHMAGLTTFHHDPGGLSARFGWRACAETIGRPHRVRYVGGGWNALVRAFEAGARARGVDLRFGERLEPRDLPTDGPVIVATAPAAAARLLERDLSWPTARTALLDLALERPGRLATIVFDLSPDLGGCCMAERFTPTDRSLAPAGVELVQAHLGIGPDADPDVAFARIERSVDALGAWRDHEVWRRAHVVEGASGAIDPPGATWSDRPAIDQGEGRYLAGDTTAAPGVLSEVAVNSGTRAAHLALAERRRRAWAPGWPSVELTASDRARILAAAVPGTVVTEEVVADRPLHDAWPTEPVDETEPNRRIRRMRRSTTIEAATVNDDGTTTLTTIKAKR